MRRPAAIGIAASQHPAAAAGIELHCVAITFVEEVHRTPAGGEQQFLYGHFRRVGAAS